MDGKAYNEESLHLTATAIRMNPINYNFWILRREILKSLKFDPYHELFWVEEIIIENPKNILSWHHRRIIANMSLSCVSISTELKLTERVLEHDTKNYFAFAHRQWSINTFKFENLGLLKEELQLTSKLLESDLRNNSAWNQRFFIMKQLGKFDFILVKKEFNFAFEKIKLAKANESSWNYLRGLLLNFGNKKLYQYQDIIDYCEYELVERKYLCTAQLVSFLIELKIEMILDDVINDSIVNCQKVYDLCSKMATRYDKLRKNYWKFVHKKFYFDKIMKRREKSDNFIGGIREDDSWKTKIGKKHQNQGDVY